MEGTPESKGTLGTIWSSSSATKYASNHGGQHTPRKAPPRMTESPQGQGQGICRLKSYPEDSD